MPYYINPMFYLWVEKQWLHMGRFIGWTIWAPSYTSVWQNSGFTWATSWADQCKLHVMPMCVWRRCNRLLMTSQWPDNCNAATWKVISKSLVIDFIHGDLHGWSCRKQWLYMCSFIGRPEWTPCNSNVWQDSGLTWAVSWADQCEPHVMPTPFLHRSQYKYIWVGIILSQTHIPIGI